jgi:hypothetical protein
MHKIADEEEKEELWEELKGLKTKLKNLNAPRT